MFNGDIDIMRNSIVSDGAHHPSRRDCKMQESMSCNLSLSIFLDPTLMKAK